MDRANYCKPVVAAALSTHIDSFDYNTNHKYRGVCLILDHETFKPHGLTRNLGPRVGTKVDSQSIAELFDKLGFDVVVKRDLTVAEIKNLLKSIAEMDHSQNDCFAMFVLTHGGNGFLFGSDSRYPTDMLFRNFIGDRCVTLVGKPKLFFLQACQGNRLDRGIVVSSDALDEVGFFRIPNYVDFLIAYSTLPGYYSFRNETKGSWFISALIHCIHKYGLDGQNDLLSIMTIVCHRMAYYSSDASKPIAQSSKAQTPCLVSMLTRRLYFHPKP